MGIRYECDRCDADAISHITIKRETPKGTPTSNSEHWFCREHLRQFDAACAYIETPPQKKVRANG